MVIDHEHFGIAIAAAAKQDFEVIHLSCHGNDDGIALSDDTRLNWAEFATIFETHQCRPLVLVMSTCFGAASGIGDAFRKLTHGPAIIFGLRPRYRTRIIALRGQFYIAICWRTVLLVVQPRPQ
jgi:hypothetical protein